jgi:hypothetical protein
VLERDLPVVIDEVAGVVEDDPVPVAFDRLDDMRRVSVEDVDAALDGGVREAAEIVARLGVGVSFALSP